MATKATAKDKKLAEDAKNAAAQVGKFVGRGVEEVWTIFLRKTIVQGISIAVTALILIFAGVWFLNGWEMNVATAILFALAIPLIYVAINFLGNPAYYSMNDILELVKKVLPKKDDDADWY